jgi:ParB family chromosome partitioning protein
MALGKGLESLIPPQRPHQPNYQPQNDGGSIPKPESQEKQAEGEKGSFSEFARGAPRSRTEFATGQAGMEERLPRTEFSSGAGSRGDDDAPAKGIIFQIEINKIKPNPHQPRRRFDEDGLRELAASIREFGVIQPLVVSKIERESAGGLEVEYELIAGERRWLAAQMAGLRTVPAIIRRLEAEENKLEMAVVENIQRADLNPIEFARAVAQLQEQFGLTQREIAVRLGKSREAIANSIRLLSLPAEMQEAVATGKMTESQARLLLTVDDFFSQKRLFEEIIKNNLSVRELAERVKRFRAPRPTAGQNTGSVNPIALDPEIMALREQLEEFLGTRVELSQEREGGRLTIRFYSKEELEGILAKLKKADTNQANFWD